MAGRHGKHIGRKRPRTTRSVIGGAVLAVVLIAVAGFGYEVGSGRWTVQPILSGSMRPGLPIGGVAVVQRVPTKSLTVRDVVLFHPPGEANTTYVHRIISLTQTSQGVAFRTQGDANVYPDPWTIHFDGRWAYEVRFTLPLLGYLAVWDHSQAGHQEMILAIGALLILLAAAAVLKGRRGRPASEAAVGGEAGSRSRLLPANALADRPGESPSTAESTGTADPASARTGRDGGGRSSRRTAAGRGSRH